MGGELGNQASIDVLLVSSALCTPFFTLIGNHDIFNHHTNLGQNVDIKTKK